MALGERFLNKEVGHRLEVSQNNFFLNIRYISVS